MTHKYNYLIFYSCQNKYSLIIKKASFVNYKTLIKRRRFKIITWSKKSGDIIDLMVQCTWYMQRIEVAAENYTHRQPICAIPSHLEESCADPGPWLETMYRSKGMASLT